MLISEGQVRPLQYYISADHNPTDQNVCRESIVPHHSVHQRTRGFSWPVSVGLYVCHADLFRSLASAEMG